MAVDLNFESMDDFSPEAIVDQVEPLKKLLNARNKLRDLLSKADRSEELENVLEEILKNTDNIAEISQQRSEEHTSELQSRPHLVCRLLLEKKKKQTNKTLYNQKY